MMGSLRQILSVAILAGLAVGGYLYYEEMIIAPAETAAPSKQRTPRSIGIEVAPAEARKLSVVMEAVGTTRALRSVDIVPHVEGRMVEIDIVAGREVAAGTVLARLDDEIEQATLAESEAILEERTRALERSEALLSRNNVSHATIDQVRSEVAIARAARERAQRRLADRTVRAPFAGVLGITAVDLGARVESDTVLTSLDDLSAVEIEFRLPETVYGQIDEGQPVTASTAAFPGRSFTGTVVVVDSRVDQTSRAFRVRARLPNEDRDLPAGMFMRLTLAMGERDAVVVTEEAILVQGGDAFLFVVEDGKAVRRRITTGLRREGVVEVETGVTAGEPVISRGIQSLRDGIAVDVMNAPPAVPAPDSGPVPAKEDVPPLATEETPAALTTPTAEGSHS
ncbi:efflux RND transporter periplasmic adaptor subunit [Pelagibius litoralis]|uniref:Efflux RND transporter periplasmic adaptor subunit n=1 Tax=Pelagibius litoralis TaxID=374515 RepID=A0A967EXU9_9PROT|nr:efflux RND transporter periplasmic adaptor subunit [Pelagibius litoralis]NIA69411.1 efflux RND transporter periplasmic adaptor subunit [Pelagibius litoralis]